LPAGVRLYDFHIVLPGIDQVQFAVLFAETWSVTLSLMKIGEI